MAVATKEKVEETLRRLLKFLNDFLPLANTHVADFLIDESWTNLVPESVQKQLLALSEAELAKLPSGELNNTGTIRDEAVQEPQGNTEVQETSDSKNTCHTERVLWDRTKLPKWCGRNLESFVIETQNMTLPSLGVLTDLNRLVEKWGDSKNDKVFVGEFMSHKKKHEVDIMADVCSVIAAHQKLDKVIDIGSGRGYLSSHLALMHGLSVLAIDSSNVNTHSAQTRNQRLEKHWAGLVRNAESATAESKKSKRKRLQQSKTKSSSVGKATDIETSTTAEATDSIRNPLNISTEHEHKDGELDMNSQDDKTKSVDSNLVGADSSPLGAGSLEKSRAKCVQITQFITPHTDLQDLVRTHLLHRNQPSPNCGSEGQAVENVNVWCTLAMKPNCDNNVKASGNSYSKQCSTVNPKSEEFSSSDVNNKTKHVAHTESTDSNVEVLLTGLHTCGNLASSTLEIFNQSRSVSAVCNVGCCYHHLDEAFIRGPFETAGEPSHYGFPMSSLLKSHGFRLGRNARMLASQTPARMATTGQISHQSLFYRALLQVMLRDLIGEVSDDWQVGKIYAKSSDFLNYTQRALKKLQIDDNGKWTEEYVKSYEAGHAVDQQRLTAFVQLRAALAPVIETLILLDRLLYLLEQESVEEAYLVQFFDPVTSPRCYGLIATRNEAELL